MDSKMEDKIAAIGKQMSQAANTSSPFRVELEVEERGQRVRVCVEGDDLVKAKVQAMACLNVLTQSGIE